MSDQPTGFATLALHAGAQLNSTTKARATSIHETVSFVFDNGDHAASLSGLQALDNSCSGITNSTNAVLEERIAALEGGSAALAVASGRAANLIVFQTLMLPGDELVASRRLHGGSIDQFHAFKNFGWTVKWADPEHPETFAAAITQKTKAIFCESVANTGGYVTDIAALSAIARQAKLPLIVDNTLATPYLVRPFEHGADIVVHSATDFLGAHGNAVAGLIVDGGTFDWMQDDRYPAIAQPSPTFGGTVIGETFGNFAFAIACRVLGLRNLGPTLSPFSAFLILMGIETLALRMQRHCQNALDVANHLQRHVAVRWVRYAGLVSDPGHALAQRYCPLGSGAVFTFGIAGGHDAGAAFAKKLKLFSHRADDGYTRSRVFHPPSTIPLELADGERVAADTGPDVIHLSIGLEDVKDIIVDLDQALAV